MNPIGSVSQAYYADRLLSCALDIVQNFPSHIPICRAGIITYDNQFCDIFALQFEDDLSPDVLCTLPAFCRSSNFENLIINKQFIC